MSKYLQRLVSTARAPSAAIRPVLGSLFSPSLYESTAKSFEAVEETVISRQPEVRASPGLQPPPAIRPAPEPGPAPDLPRVQTQTPVAQAAARSEDSRPISEATEPSEPLSTEVPQGTGPMLDSEGAIPTSEAKTPFTPLLTEVSQRATPALKTNGKGGLREKPVDSAQPRGEQSGQQIPPQRPYRPLMVETLPLTDAKTLWDSSPLTSDARKIEKTDFAPRVAQPEREADEIQIHIGRIEVTAVPPPPVRPPASPVRKSLRLDEYLRRGRERAL
jgi:hypothetical protein